MKSLLKLLPLFLLITNAFAVDHPTFEDFADKGEILAESDSAIRTLKIGKKGKLKLQVHTRNFRSRDLLKLYQAVQILEKVMNSKQLKNLILNYKYAGEEQFHQNKDMSNLEIYEHLMTGSEDINPGDDQVMNFDLTMYRSWNPWSKVKGYTKPDTLRIWIHSKYYRRSSWTPVDVAANMAHEWVHKMGFGHDYYYNQDRRYSVPYAIGGLVTEVAKKMGY